MKSIVRAFSLAAILLGAGQATASPASSDDQIAWVADFRAACGMAAEQRRLVLLHFYNDNCEWCVRLEQNVFSKPEVAEAVAQNYLAVKIHAGKQPQLASRYRVKAFPTDVIVTPSGLEVYRTISRQSPADYIGVLNQVAQQTGVSAARQWKSQLPQPGQSATSAVAAAASDLGANAQIASSDAASQAQNALNEARQRWGDAAIQVQKESDEARAAALEVAQQGATAVQDAQQRAADASQQVATKATQWSQLAAGTVQRYEQQAGDAYRQYRDQTSQTAEQYQQAAQAARQEWRAVGPQTSEQLNDTARELKNKWQAAGSGSLLDRRSAFTPHDPSPASEPVAAATSELAAAAKSASAAPPAPAAAASQPAAANQPSLPTENPFVTRRQFEKPPTADSAATRNAPTAQAAPAAASTTGLNEATAAQPPAIPPQPQSGVASIGGEKHTLVPASQAPPIGLDGFCPVTLLETVARDPGDRSAWKKGDQRIGAIHRGRTYLFTSEENQRKFLANPDAYAPVLAGCDPVHFAERGELRDGKRAYGLVTPDRRIFLFADEASRNRFEKSPDSYSAAIQQAMRSDTGSTYR